ncbi:MULTISPECIES: glycerol kinase GlpK [unclassified Microbacterium]|uniref:glycerol kinase GlpK n=1 Tax=unclassified Microbacterium TaxID=2609290 RepID=UPI0006F4CE49|nr:MULTISPECIES: glycerol kinase GlpK [unclassified Microbacterium]KQR89269.1 glycerol kinase [Microbacterium sp. Leaf179]KQT74393.1 glycerol kinase [Microbacterium sp. Leaf436]MBD8205584.1 glycerol kinase GlpK [Microbacterium sp. CFBP 8801]MBD8218955.1 glycerol kinase GlpK [Microbacterium sp. CFBP 13617]MBD8478629.1 glycerol kinase GlpK [Microbacterium sp. CFBP 8794]
MADYVLAIDQGTTSTRAMIFDKSGSVVSVGQKEHEQIFPRAGWVEHDPLEIWRNTQEVIGLALSRADITRHDIAAVGITNQRETAVVWDKNTGKPVYNAIVWQDTRTQSIVDRLADGDPERYKSVVGLPLATYFSGTKIVWILENVDGAREKAEAGDLVFGTTDTWVLWNLTGGIDGGVHATDVTNASRTLFMDLETLEWRDDILADFGVPRSMMPEIRSSSEVYGAVESSSLLRETPIAGILGDQQAATFGQAAFDPGESKNTYGTGNFLIFQTGEEIVRSKNGLLTTLGYKLGDQPAHYALEGSIAVTGSLIQWLRDQLGIISSAPEVEALARTVDDNGGVYFVPAFSGLFAPYWRPDARGAIVGMTRFVNKGHIARAALEATAFQTREVLEAVNADSGVDLTELKVDGGMTANDELMQFQADILGVPVVRPVVAETTALGAAYAAGLAVGFWNNLDDLRANWQEDKRWEPDMDSDERDRELRLWKKAVTKSMDWVDDDVR